MKIHQFFTEEMEKTAVASDGRAEKNSPPRLCYFTLPTPSPLKLPAKPAPEKRTAAASVPFRWEEAPGKPRLGITKPEPETPKGLELPPRLLMEAKVAGILSPTTLLGGPHVGRSLMDNLAFGSFRGFDSVAKCNKERVIFGSGRWGSFRKNVGDIVFSGRFEYPPPMVVHHGGNGCRGTKVKVAKIRGESFIFSHTKSQLWASIKQIVPWKRQQS